MIGVGYMGIAQCLVPRGRSRVHNAASGDAARQCYKRVSRPSGLRWVALGGTHLGNFGCVQLGGSSHAIIIIISCLSYPYPLFKRYTRTLVFRSDCTGHPRYHI